VSEGGAERRVVPSGIAEAQEQFRAAQSWLKQSTRPEPVQPLLTRMAVVQPEVSGFTVYHLLSYLLRATVSRQNMIQWRKSSVRRS
jgi:hypothetical protein